MRVRDRPFAFATIVDEVTMAGRGGGKLLAKDRARNGDGCETLQGRQRQTRRKRHRCDDGAATTEIGDGGECEDGREDVSR